MPKRSRINRLRTAKLVLALLSPAGLVGFDGLPTFAKDDVLFFSNRTAA